MAKMTVPPHALHHASILESQGADVRETDEDDTCALHHGALAGYAELCLTLFEHGAKANVQGGHCGNALQSAYAGGHIEVVQQPLDTSMLAIERSTSLPKLVEHLQIRPDHVCDKQGRPLLHRAARGG